MKVATYRLGPDASGVSLDVPPEASLARFGDDLLLVSGGTRGMSSRREAASPCENGSPKWRGNTCTSWCRTAGSFSKRTRTPELSSIVVAFCWWS